ncbi:MULTISPECIES: 2-phospho-L-lactate transferase [unclassified Curtobacterium]|uniref:2-phospho-L-lactate transferase n=1 Tax=unclassified Curtobacterium TaxID=257496 RepID=UPI000DA7778D|nr:MULTISPECIES: 2-phospho-L-lactate transferase [unclassified Curtobacterium]PZE75041.1 2-phospho-L-lactate transferase [Curtobacterium sp. MCBD17_019]WIB62524.1 2-phospho-L-lactate transferase [Curtobacterium sp. MCBD17_040]
MASSTSTPVPTRRSVTVLAGGVGGGRFARGVRHLARQQDLDVTVVVNTGDDLWLTGLRVCPDLDSVMYALADANDTERGWGRAGESERVSAELTAYGVGWPWFTLGDLDLGTHIARTAMLRDGDDLTRATARLAARWALDVTLLPVTDDEVPTLVDVDRPDGTRDRIHFEEWWVRHRAAIPTHGFVQQGVERASVSAAAAAAIRGADVVLLAPSNPVVSIGTMLGVPGVREALAAARGPVVGVAPVIGGRPVRGMADVCCAVAGVEATAAGIARHYGARRDGGLLDAWLVDEVDADAAAELQRDGLPARAVPLWMTDDDATADMTRAALALGLEARGA